VFVNGANLNVKVTGSGPAVMALHGFAGNMSTWEQFTSEAQQNYTLITVDLLGHGDSDSPKDPARYRVENTVADLGTILDNLDVRRACWLGYSMGGRISLVASTLIPDKCAALVLEGASPGLSSVEQRAEREISDHALARFIEEEGIEAFHNYWEQQPLFASQRLLPPEVQERIRNQRVKSNPTGLANTLRAAGPGTQLSVREHLSSLKLPVLCVAGEYDEKFCSIAEEMCRLLPNGRVSIVRGAGHAPHLEKSQDFNSLVLEFLESIGI